MKRTVRFSVSMFSRPIFAALVLTILAGCGPSRKEYAINEALLVDQTRVLENQLYRAHFQIQRLEGENKQLRARLEAKGEKLDDLPKTAPFDPVPEMNVPQTTQNARPINAVGNNRFAMKRNAAGAQTVPQKSSRVVRTAQAPARTASGAATQRQNPANATNRVNAVKAQPLTP